jgi:excisionase family DNA binding protein
MTRKEKNYQEAKRDSALALTLTSTGQVPVGALGTADAARYLSISIITLRRQVRDGKLIPSRMTRHLKFSIRELNRWLEEGRCE